MKLPSYIPMKDQLVKCGYKYCTCTDDLVKSDAVKIGNRYYHKQCSVEKHNKEQVFSIYKKYYKSSESEMIINKVINQVVNEKGFNSEYVLYALCKAIRTKMPMKNIFAIHYIVNNSEWIKAYELMKAKEELKNITFDNVDVSSNEILNYNHLNTNKWADTLFK